MKNAIAYVDDIIIFSSSQDQQKRDLNELFQRFHCHKIVINPAKSNFGMCNLNFLGHLVTLEGILPFRDRVKAVEDYPRPYSLNTSNSERFWDLLIITTGLFTIWLTTWFHYV